MISYQKDVYDLLPTDFSRKQVISLALELNLYGNTAVSYIHHWLKRGLIANVDRGRYRKNSEHFIAGRSKELEALMAPPADIQMPEAPEEDAVLASFNIKSATDDELLRELVLRGYTWDKMQKTVTKEVNYADYG